MYGTYDKHNIKSAFKFNFNTVNVNKNANRNYGGYLNKSYELESFLNSTYNMNYDINTMISHIINKDLSDIIFKLPVLIHTTFNSFNLNLELDDKYDGDKWIVVSILTSMDPQKASDLLDELEENLYNRYGDTYLTNILLSVEFVKS